MRNNERCSANCRSNLPPAFSATFLLPTIRLLAYKRRASTSRPLSKKCLQTTGCNSSMSSPKRLGQSLRRRLANSVPRRHRGQGLAQRCLLYRSLCSLHVQRLQYLARKSRVRELRIPEFPQQEAIIEARGVEKSFLQPDGHRVQIIAPLDRANIAGTSGTEPEAAFSSRRRRIKQLSRTRKRAFTEQSLFRRIQCSELPKIAPVSVFTLSHSVLRGLPRLLGW